MIPASDLPYRDAALWADMDISRYTEAVTATASLPSSSEWTDILPQRLAMESARHGRRQHSFRSGVFEHARTLGQGGSGRHHVIDQNHRASPQAFPVRHAERVAHVLDALFPRQSDLGDGGALANQDSGCAFHPPREASLRRAGNQFCLIESARTALALMQRDRNDEWHGIPAAGKQLFDGMRQHSAQHGCNRGNGVVLEEMNQVAQTTFVFSEGNRAGKLGLKVAAIAAAAVTHQQLRTGEKIATDHTLRLAQSAESRPGIRRRQEPAKYVQWGAAEPAIGGEQDGKNIAQEVLQGRDKDGTLRGALSFAVFALASHDC